MPQAPGPFMEILFATALLVPLGGSMLGLAYLLGLTIADGFKRRKKKAH